MISGTIKPEKLVDGLMPVSELVDECVVDVDESGWDISAVDKPQIGLVTVNILDDLFMSYDCSACSIGVNNEKLVRLLRVFCEYNAEVTVNVDESLNTLTLDNGKLTYEMELLDNEFVDSDEEIPEVDADCSVVVDSSEFSRIASGATTVSDLITFQYEPSGEFIVVSENEEADFRYTVGEGGNEVLQTVSSVYRSDYIDAITHVTPEKTELRIEFSESYPFKLQFAFEDGDIDTEYIVAPRIESNRGDDNE